MSQTDSTQVARQENKNSAQPWFNSFVMKTPTNETLIAMLIKFEWYGKLIMTCPRGYSRCGKLSKWFHIVHWISHLWLLLIIARSLLLIHYPSDELTVLLGDFFSGSSNSPFYHTLLIFIYIQHFSAKIAVHINESQNSMKSLSLVTVIIDHNFDSKQLFLNSEALKEFKLFLFWSLQFFAKVGPSHALFFFSMFITFTLQSSFFYHSIANMAWFTYWTLLIAIPFCFNSFALFWLFPALLFSMTYSNISFSFFIKEMNYLVDNIAQQRVQDAVDEEIVTFIRNLHKILDLVDKINADYRYLSFIGYIMLALGLDFAFFLALFINQGSPFTTTILISIGIIGIIVLSVLFYFGSLANVKLRKLCLQIYKIHATGGKYLKLRAGTFHLLSKTLERLNKSSMGFTVAQLFTATQHSFLIFILENAAIFLMLVSTFVKR